MTKKQEKSESVAKKLLVAPKFDLVGPNVEDDINRAFTRYGKDVVLKAVKRLTSKARGRPTEKDWVLLEDVLIEDAKVWLTGGDPFSTRSNYSIAKDFADRNPGQSHPAVMKRIEKKLR